jgi:TRAP transporter 4TM/12TM fusion protein
MRWPGPIFPGLLKHAGASWSQLINHQYLTSQGVYGVAVGVVATYVFHFVLFGVLATRVGLGQLFLDVASSIAGRYAGGPAKVSVFGSAMFGMLSGSSVANAVTVGSLTIPAMIRVGYKREFAGAVEAASSTGGQITPPVLGAAAFLMIEFLSVPYQTIIVAAAIPAFMHFFGVFMQVHFEAKRFGLRGLTEEEMPKLRQSLAERWPTLIPLFLLIFILVSGRTPYLAAFSGITSAPSWACARVARQHTGVTGPCWWACMRYWLCCCLAASKSESIKLAIFGVALVATPLLLKFLKLEGRIGLPRWWNPSAPAPSTRWRWALRRPRWAW